MGDMADDYMADDFTNGHDWVYKTGLPRKRTKVKAKAKAKVATTAPRTPKTPKTPKAHKLELLLKSIVERFPNDPTAPGLAIAWLPDEKQFYISIRRFGGPFGAQPRVFIAVRNPTLLEAMTELVAKYKAEINQRSATEEFLRLR
jgi:hypothetical protein